MSDQFQRARPGMAEVRAAYDEQKSAFDRRFLFGPLRRRLSFYPTVACLRLGISATGATWASLVAGVAGCLVLAVGTREATLLGVAGVVVWFVLDYVDGNLARTLRQTSRYGKFLDDTAGFVLESGVFLAAGAALHARPLDTLSLGLGPGALFAAGALASLSNMLRDVVHAAYRELFAGPATPGGASPEAKPSLVVAVYANLANFAGLVVPFMVIAALFDALDVWVLSYAVIFGLTFVVTFANLIRKARARDLR